MNKQEILEKAIQKAIDGGFNFDHWRRRNRLAEGEKPNGDTETALVYNHDFAKALWPPKLLKVSVTHHTSDMTHQGERSVLEGWQYHLQQMVIADDPVKYLGANI